MTMKRPLAVLLPLAVACALPMIAAAQSAPAPPARPQQPITAEKNPPGDIPDNQAFVAFKSPLGFAVKAPEGWARRELPNGVSFSDKYNELQVAVAPAATAPTLAALQAGDIAVLEKSPRAVRVAGIKPVALPAGNAFVAHYSANSDPNPVTNKAVRLENARYYFWKAGRLATLTLSAPAGADNADQWLVMARSFTWQ